MLHELDIANYAVVERIRVPFRAGLNVLTGETGSGKSIVVGSLALLLGARASVDLVRSGASKARVSGRFDPPSDRGTAERLARSGIDLDGDELILERQVLATGKSRAYVNGTPVTVALLRELAPHIGDIHGQHEQQTLLSPALQLRLLDSYAGCEPAARALRAVHRHWRDSEESLRRLQGSVQERLRRIDLLRYQLAEIRDAEPVAGEDQDLERELDVLANVGDLRQCGFEAYGALYDSSSSATSQLKAAAVALFAGPATNERFGAFADRLDEARSAVDDVAFELRAYLERLEADPRRLEAVDGRLDVLRKLKRKYGPSLDDVLAFATRCEVELAALDRRDREVERLEAEVAGAAEEFCRRAGELTQARREAAASLSGRAAEELRDLALANSRFEIAMERLPSPSAQGVDRVSFLFSANPGQPRRPLRQVASGGELSRVALAVKTCLEPEAAGGPFRRTLVFDEIDSGVGGRVAESIGRRLKGLSAGSQVLCVTHLPQIACFADAHFHVSKFQDGERTAANVAELSRTERTEEIARMLSGTELSSAALENARQLLRSGGAWPAARRRAGAGIA